MTDYGIQPSATQLPSGLVVVNYAEYWRNPLNGAYSWVVRVTTSSDLINWSWPAFTGLGNCLAPCAAPLSSGQVLLPTPDTSTPPPISTPPEALSTAATGLLL
ncbi:MAG: hypothetical protein ACYCXF_08550 [Thermoleophilia bacterium]